MRPYLQMLDHKPEKGIYGDCLRAVVASLLNIPPQYVPHFLESDNDDWLKKLQEYLNLYSLSLVSVPFGGSDVDAPIEGVLETMGFNNPDLYYMLTAGAEVGNHVVVCKGDKIVHDPAVQGGEEGDTILVGPCDNGFYFVEFLAYNSLFIEPLESGNTEVIPLNSPVQWHSHLN